MIEFLSGVASGLSQTIVGYPLDTIKVRIQNKIVPVIPKQYSHIFRGITIPLFSTMFINGVVFGTYNKVLTTTNSPFLSGSVSGLMATPFVFLSDIYKTMYQVSNTPEFTMTYIKNRKGIFTTSMREMLAFGSYFYTYDYLHNKKKYNPLLSGGIAGMVNWTLTYPLDTLRNRQMIHSISIKEAYDMGYIWKGYSYCLCRAFLVNATGFYVYEFAKQKMLEEK